MIDGDNYDKKLKLILLGDSGVGKSNIILRIKNSEFQPSHIPSIGVEMTSKTYKINNEVVKTIIWDTIG